MRQSGPQVVVALATTALFDLRQVKLREAKKTQQHCVDRSLLSVLKPFQDVVVRFGLVGVHVHHKAPVM